MSTTPARTIYQLKVVPLGVSPLIWRRRLVRSDSTMADLHPMLQIAMGWRDTHLKGFALTRFVSFTPVRR
jgi:Plasmid pRiA4b ORF-3-like protein